MSVDAGDHPCLVCGRVRDDPLHDQGPRGGLAHDTDPRIEHTSDESVWPRWEAVRRLAERIEANPGERRRAVRRMDDRIRIIEEAVREHT